MLVVWYSENNSREGNIILRPKLTTNMQFNADADIWTKSDEVLMLVIYTRDLMWLYISYNTS